VPQRVQRTHETVPLVQLAELLTRRLNRQLYLALQRPHDRVAVILPALPRQLQVRLDGAALLKHAQLNNVGKIHKVFLKIGMPKVTGALYV
jgi:hypothetical protein